MRIATLSIGDELILGQVTDTNAGTIARALLDQGLRLQRHLTVGDNELDIMDAINDLGGANDVVIVTGGLGPTLDDLTAHAAARATGRRLVLNEEARDHVRAMSGKLASLIVCPLNDKQALIPDKSTLIPNRTGTACGFHLICNGCFMFFLPGVPSEMAPMLHESVVPFLLERATKRPHICFMHFNLFGPCEAEVDDLLTGIARPDLGLYLGICVTFPWMRITLRAEAVSDAAADELLAPAARTVRERLESYIFSEGAETMDEALAALFRKSGLTLALAESCSGGMIAKRITDVAGSSAYFLESAVTYSNAAKERLLGVPVALLEEKGAVSSECAEAMARGVCRAAGSDLGLAVTGIAGPDGGSPEKPVGTVFIALATQDGCRSERFQFHGSRDEVRIITAWTALDWLRRYLSGAQ